MSHMYAILAVIGWVWTALFVVLAILWLRSDISAHGFDVIDPHEKQS